MLTPDFGTMQNAVKVDSSEKLAGFECLPKTQTEAGDGPARRNFEVWAIAIRSHLESRNCVQSTEILYPEHYSADYALKMISYEKTFCMNCLRLVESVDFHIKIVSIRVRMQKLELSECSHVKRRNKTRETRHVLASV